MLKINKIDINGKLIIMEIFVYGKKILLIIIV